MVSVLFEFPPHKSGGAVQAASNTANGQPGQFMRTLMLLAALVAAEAAAQQPQWPGRVVRIIATSPPGGSIDLLARIVAEECAKSFGQPFIVENRPGGNGNLGVDLVVKAPADGHALFVTAPGPFS